ncbi:CNNM transmembrane domain-containing protein [Caenorhabditis elegans]|uniref:CNNM transmembrane domain-containing protein n=1 Tax=Caenorhabditis elegans TaxID=6239 RepID=Q20271_CAEEL|nr:CNNM transmembrane domain-containing protein [Caenorhabditis elegans]CCD67899.1 CNNM transmembrane domain-containing protein [Caenorhabditis elegans]|eukprot:NP_509163.1 Uncharacterized protein CELE_F41C6.6 [Caenorhabditis elegans]
MAILGFTIPFLMNCALIGSTALMMIHNEVKKPSVHSGINHDVAVRDTGSHQSKLPSDNRARGTTGNRAGPTSNHARCK